MHLSHKLIQALLELRPDTKIDVRKTGTHMAVKFESTGDQEWELLGYEVEAESVGRRGT